MPLKIVRNQVHISHDFMPLVCEMYRHWMYLYRDDIDYGVRNPKHSRYGVYAQIARRLFPIIKGVSPDVRIGYDYERTRFLGAPFTEFTVITGPNPVPDLEGDIRWLVGRTRHVQTTLYNDRKWVKEQGRFVGTVMGELGPYSIYIPETIVEHPDLYHIHMIPQRHKRSKDRHYHHYIECETDQAVDHPLSYRTGNCWSEYQQPLKGMIDFPNYPELFRQLYVHLSTYGVAPPRHVLDFNTTTPEA